MNFHDCVVLTGATASGKSTLALGLAAGLNGEIVAVDSMTLYRGMDIGTAKPSAADRAAVPHHLIDVLDPWESANVAWWLEQATAAVADIRGRGRLPILVGGTPFYLKALLHGLFPSPATDHALRATLEAEAERDGPAAFHARLAAVDPVSAARLHPNDTRRVVRALEIFTQTGTPLGELQTTWAGAPTPIPTVVLDVPRDELYARIDRRVRAMADAGWPAEAAALARDPRGFGREAGQALGYPEWAAFAAGQATREDTIALIQTRTRQFAKRQLTWFRSLPVHAWVQPGPAAEADVRAAWAAARAGTKS